MARRQPVLAFRHMRTLFGVGGGRRADGHGNCSTSSRRHIGRRPRPPSRHWSSATGRWCSASAGACWATRTTSTTPSRPRFWCWCARPARSGCGTRSAPGCTAWPSGSRPRRRSPRPGGRRTSAGPPRPPTASREASDPDELARGTPRGSRPAAAEVPRTDRALLPRGPDPRRGRDGPGLARGDGQRPAGAGPGPAAHPPRPARARPLGRGARRDPLGGRGVRGRRSRNRWSRP